MSYVSDFVAKYPGVASTATDLVVYHRTDMDGRLGAAIAYQALDGKGSTDPGTTYYLGLNREDVTVDDILTAFPNLQQVYLIDYSFDPDLVFVLTAREEIGVCLLDHHETAIKAIGSAICDWHCAAKKRLCGVLPVLISTDVVCCKYFEVLPGRQSGVSLAWRFFFPNEAVPRAVDLIRIYDTWSQDDQDWIDALHLNTALLATFDTFPNFDSDILAKLLVDDRYCDDLIEQGVLAERINCIRNTQDSKSYGGTLEWEGITFLALNASGNSRVAEPAAIDGVHEAVLLYRWAPRAGHWKVSLYNCTTLTAKPRLCDIATKYGGGGHPGACGFQAKKLPFNLEDIKPL